MNRHAVSALIAVAGTACINGAALAQSFNVDLGVQSGNGSGVIASSFAACGKPGSWNVIWPTTAQNTTLVDTTGAMTSVTLARPTGVVAVVPAGNADTGDFGKLMADGFQVNTANDTDTYTFDGLTAGRYLVYTYFANAAAGIDVRADVAGFVGESMQVTGGSTANTFKAGGNYSLSLAEVSSNGELSIAVTRMNAGSQANVAGFSLVKLGGSRKVIHIKSGGSGDRSGTSWANAMPGLVEPMQLLNGAYGYQTATSDATVDIDQWIAGGYYNVTQDVGPSRDQKLWVLDGMSMYGGFAGTETSLSQRTSGHESVITGHIGSLAITDNTRQLAEFDQCSGSTVVDRLTFADAYDERVSVSLFQGRGAGVMVMQSNSPSADDGPVFRDVTFRNNLAGSEGGAVYVYLAKATFDNCSFENNRTLVTNGDGAGGAVYDNSLGSVFLYSDFFNNTSKKGSAVYVRHSGSVFQGCRMVGNHGSTSTIHIEGGQTTEFANSLIAGNDNGLNAAAIYAQGENADIALRNTTVAHNSSVGYAAGILLRDGADANVFNSIIWGNQPSLSEPGFEGQASIDVVNGPTTVAFARSTVQHGSTLEVPFALTPYQNNELNPMFKDINGVDNVLGNADDDYRLATGSPAIDSGDISFAPTDYFDLDGDSVVWEETPYDLDGHTRLFDMPGVGGNGNAFIIDRGPYESVPACHADLNGDGVLDFFDVQTFLNAFSNGNALADFNSDGTYDFFDVQAFLNAFSAGCP